MINVLLLPFLCMSAVQGELKKAIGEPFSMNEIGSIFGDDSLKNEAYMQTYRRDQGRRYFENTYNEKTNSHSTFEKAERFEFPNDDETDETKRYYDRITTINGSLSSSNKEDYYSFVLKDRMLADVYFKEFNSNTKGEVYDEQKNKLFEFYSYEDTSPSGILLKKGGYHIKVYSTSNDSSTYSISFGVKYVDSKETLTIDDEFMKKYQALVWESDYVPGGAKPIDGIIIKKGSKSRRLAWVYTGNFFSCNVDEEFLYRSIYIWTTDAFESIQRDVEKYKAAAKQVLSKNSNIVTNLSIASNALGGIALVVSFLPVVGTALGTAISTVSLETAICGTLIGDETKLDNSLVELQCARMIGSLDSASTGTVISIKERTAIKMEEESTKYTKKRTYKLEFGLYLGKTENGSDTYSCVERKYPNQPFPLTYDVKLHHNVKEGNQSPIIVSDCQGTFKAYTNFHDIKSLIKTE